MNEPQFHPIRHRSGIIGAVASRIGGRSENQDSFMVSDTPLGLLVAVCDGMGGGPAGKTASLYAAEAIANTVANAEPTMDPADVLRVAIKNAHKVVVDATIENPELSGMGTTCVCVLINAGKAYIGHVGDSRCYQIRGNASVFRTADHSYVAEMVRRGTLTEEEARNSNFSNVITQAIGGGDKINPEIDVVSVAPKDRFALMSDGIWGAMPEASLVAALATPDNIENVVEEISIAVDKMGENQGGGHDNLTLAMIELPGVETADGFRPQNAGVSAAQQEAWSESADETGENPDYSIEDDLEANAADAAERAAQAAREAAIAAEEARQAVAAAGMARSAESAPAIIQSGGRTLADKVAAEHAAKKAINIQTEEPKPTDTKAEPAAKPKENEQQSDSVKKWRPLFWGALGVCVILIGLTVWTLFFRNETSDPGIITDGDSKTAENAGGNNGNEGSTGEFSGIPDKGSKPSAEKSKEEIADKIKEMGEGGESQQENTTNPPAQTAPQGAVANLKEAKRLMESLTDTKIEPISKDKQPSEFKARELKFNKTKESIVNYIQKAYDATKDEGQKKQIESVKKKINEMKISIDRKQGRPTEEFIKQINKYNNNLGDIISGLEKQN